ncbi:MAG: YerC/YecD family TrpR-related protein [Patescibacteria group bacterium]|jgi:TrpR-related protein YerC/YecD
MPKRSISWNQKKTNDLFSAILLLKNTDECRRFFRDLCTLEEIADMSDRWQIVKMIIRKVPYRSIASRLKVSTTTVARVAQWLRHGQDGYQLILKRLGNNKT